MFTIDKYNKMRLTKGDTASINIEVVDLDGKPYSIKSTDTITMTVKKTAKSLVAFSINANEEHKIVIHPVNTNSLPTGLYIYDIQLTTQEGNVYTIVPQNFFELLDEVTS